MANHIRVDYYAILREQSGRDQEWIETDALTPKELYEQLTKKYHFTIPVTGVQVAINDEFSDWHIPLQDNDNVVFIPPVAGG